MQYTITSDPCWSALDFWKTNGWRLWTFVFSFCHLNFCQSRGNWPNFMFDNFWGRWTNLHEGLMSRKPFGTTFANIDFLAYQLLIENWVLSRNMMPWNIWTFSSLLGKPSWRLDEPWTILYTSHLLHFYTRQIFSNLNFCQSRKIVFFLRKMMQWNIWNIFEPLGQTFMKAWWAMNHNASGLRLAITSWTPFTST